MRLSRIITVGGFVGLSSLALAGCSLPFMGEKPSAEQPQNPVDQMANAVELSAMMSTGQAGSCIITDTTNPEQGRMEVAVKGKKFVMKGSNFSVDAQDPTQKSNPKIGYMLNDTEYTYVWEDQATTGMKMKAAEPASEQTPELQAATADLGPAPATKNQNPLDGLKADPRYNITCQLTDVPDEMFMPPSTVNFMDLSQGIANPAMMQQQALPQNTNAAGQ